MVAKGRQRATGSPKVVEVGEIDTSAPFQSVKDAVSRFGEVAFSGSGEKPPLRKPKAYSAEKVLAKESQLHLAQKELNKLKDQLGSAELTKSQALAELEKAKRTVDDLTQKLDSVTQSKNSAIRVTEAAKDTAKQIEETKSSNTTTGPNGSSKQDLESVRERYLIVFTELDNAKQELQKIRHESDALLEAKLAAINQATATEKLAKGNAEKAGELSKEISVIQESIGQVKLASLEAQQEQGKIFAEKDALKQSYKATLEASANKLLKLKNDFDPEVTRNLEKQLAETMDEIDGLQKKMENAKALDLDSVRVVTLELDGAKESLQKVAEEESSLRNLVESLKLELENVKKEHGELREKEAETESIVGNLNVKLCKTKDELEAVLAEESKTRGDSEEIISTIQQLSSEAENARHEAEEMKRKADELKKEAEAARIALEEAEQKLRAAMEEADEAKTSEERALGQINTLTERTSAARASTSESSAKITISKDEYESLTRKVQESETLGEMKVGAAMAQVEAVKASENEAIKRLEKMRKEIEEMKTATMDALKRAEMAEAAKKAVEVELRKWREREQKKAVETAARILAERETSFALSPHNSRVQKQNTGPQKGAEVNNLEKKKSSASKKVLLSNMSLFQRKKSRAGGASPSYLPGEKPV